MDYGRVLRRNRKKPIADLTILSGQQSFTELDYGVDAIKKIIPHRDPFLLVDHLSGVDLSADAEVIFGSRYIDPADPVFKGHFPDFPVYPGSLQVEMLGQLGLTLSYFFLNKTNAIAENATPAPVRATKILGALFLEPLVPGKTVQIIAKKLEYDGYFGTVLSQVIVNGKVSCVSISEVIFLDD